MFISYMKTAVRHMMKDRGHSFIKIFGLSLGIASCLFIYLFVADELSFDKFHKNSDSLFRLVQVQLNRETGRETGLQQFIPAPVGPELIQSVPDILSQTRFVAGQGALRFKDNVFSETVTLVDAAFLEMFTFPLISGDPRSALVEDHQLVLTRSCAAKYFGDEDPLGQTVTLTFGEATKDFVVSGVARDVPRNSTLQFDILIPFHNLPAVTNEPEILGDWARWYCPLFVELRPGATSAGAGTQLDRFCRQFFGTAIKQQIANGHDPFTLGLQKVEDMYLDTRVAGTAGLATSYLLSAIALGILLIACVNFMNLSIGTSSARSVEVGMRQVLGAGRADLLRQFASETLLTGLFAIVLALAFVELLLPRFNALAGKQLSLATFFAGGHWLALLGIWVFAGLLAGSYPALLMSSFRPTEIMKGKMRIGGRTWLTRTLVVAQFALSVVLAISAVVLGRQVKLMLGKDLGYTSEGLFIILTQDNAPAESERTYQRFRNEVMSRSQIEGLTASNREFGLFLPRTSLEIRGRKVNYRFNRVDPAFLTTMKCRLVAGRDFSPNVAADSQAAIISQRLANELGPDFQLGGYLGDASKGFPYDRRVVGVIEDVHVGPVRTETEPLILYVGEGESPRRNVFSRIIVRVRTDRLTAAVSVLETAWKKVQPDKPFVSYFQDDALRGLYYRERRWSAIVLYASALSLLLACLGVFGLTSVTLSRRVKEIGVRKVLGASAGQIFVLATREFIWLISLANIIAWPVVYWTMKRALSGYAFRVEIAPTYFILAWLGSVVIAVLTIFYLSARAAVKNPIDSLRYE